MKEGIRSYAEWFSLAKSLGYDGPYELVGRPIGRQFVYRDGGTAARWNSEHDVGYVFDPPSPPQQPAEPYTASTGVCPAPIDGKTTAAECVAAGQCGCDESDLHPSADPTRPAHK